MPSVRELYFLRSTRYRANSFSVSRAPKALQFRKCMIHQCVCFLTDASIPKRAG
jgi:hypothetical protein